MGLFRLIVIISVTLPLFKPGCGASASELNSIHPPSSDRPFQTWSTYGGDASGSKFSELNQIHQGNVSQLQVAWRFKTAHPGTLQCNPMIVEDRIYLTTSVQDVVALNAVTGEQVWRWTESPNRTSRGVNRGLAYWPGDKNTGIPARLFHVVGSKLYALNIETGETISSFGESGSINLNAGLDRDLFGQSVTATSPGIVFNDLLIMGSRVGEGPAPSAPGHVRAFDVRSGERRWIFHTIPYPGEPGRANWPNDAWLRVGGANAWGGFTLDPIRGLVFFGTGSPAYDHFGGDRVGRNDYANSVVALRAMTGDLVWHFQTVHHDLWDYDNPCPPNLVTLQRPNGPVDAIAQVTKVGHVFVLDRETGAPLFPVEERGTPQSEIPGESSWPTQPFPLAPPPYAKQGFFQNDISSRSAEVEESLIQKFENMDFQFGPLFIPPGKMPTATMPQFNGGTDWGGAAYDPRSNVLYVNSSSELEWISMRELSSAESVSSHELGRRLYQTLCSNCHGSPGYSSANAPSLENLESRLSKNIAGEILAQGKGQMPPFGALSEWERDAALDFIYGTGKSNMLNLQELESTWGESLTWVDTGHHEIKDSEGFPVNQPPWGTLTAIDLNQGSIIWQTPLGTYPALEKQGLPPTGTFNMGGAIVTAGGLVFIGGAMDERFHAYDQQTGELLWEYQMDAGGYATPATYEVNGVQYIIIAAGGAGKPGTRAGDGYYVFSLGTLDSN